MDSKSKKNKSLRPRQVKPTGMVPQVPRSEKTKTKKRVKPTSLSRSAPTNSKVGNTLKRSREKQSNQTIVSKPKSSSKKIPAAVEDLSISFDFSVPDDNEFEETDFVASTLHTVKVKIGDRFLNYKILELLGQGGMGKVYKVFDSKLKRIVALKIISGVYSETEIQRLQNEAQATARINHPNIVQLYEVGQEPSSYFTMEYIEGDTLTTYCKKYSLPGKKIAKIFVKMANALHEAHQKNIIHRDIKPSNIMVDRKSEPKIMDFGLAKSEGNRISRTGDVIGTPAYMSPEQASGTEVDIRADVYSLGATLYEALTKCPPFQGESNLNILSRIATEEVIPPRTINPDISVGLEAICLKCLDKSPERRYSSMEALEKDLRNFIEKKPLQASTPGAWSEIKKLVKKSPIIALGILLIFLMLPITSIYLHQKNQEVTVANFNLSQTNSSLREENKNYLATKQDKEKLEQEKTELEEKSTSLQAQHQEQSESLKKLANQIRFAEKINKIFSQEVLVLYNQYNVKKNTRSLEIKGLHLYLNRKIKIDKKDYLARYQRGQFYFLFQKYDKALQDLNIAIKQKPDYAKSYFVRGLIFHQIKKDYTAAEKDFYQLIQLEPENGEAFSQLGRIHFSKKDYPNALNYFTKAIRYSKDSRPFNYLKRAEVYYQLKQNSLAESDFRTLIKLAPSSDHFKYRGDFYFSIEKFSQALFNWQIAIELGHPETPTLQQKINRIRMQK